MAFLLPYLATAAATYGGHKLATMGEHHSSHSSSHHDSGGGMEKMDVYNHGQKKLLRDMIKRINPKMLDLMKSPLFKQSQQYIQDFLKKSPNQQYKNFEKPIMSQFNQKIVPEIATRFAGLGGLSSSGFQQSLGAAGANLSERLGMLREGLKSNYQGMQLQAAGMGANMANMPIQNTQNMINQALGQSPYAYGSQQQGFGAGAMPGVLSSVAQSALPWIANAISGWGGGGGGGGAAHSQIFAPESAF